MSREVKRVRAAALPATGTPAAPDPIFAAIAKWRPLKTAMDNEHDDAAIDAAAVAEMDARLEACSVIPETPAGLLALIDVYLETAWCEMMGDENAIPLNSIFVVARKLIGPAGLSEAELAAI